MKFKLTADKNDVKIFAIFAIVLLYLVALLVHNLPSVLSEGLDGFSLLPISAFTDKIGYTLTIFLAFLIGSLLSVKSHFFEFEKGFGVKVSSGATGGYSDWAREKDIKTDNNVVRVEANQKTSEAAGVPLICNGKELWVDNGEYHTLVIGATGSGKTQDTILPTMKVLAKKGESIICTDPKGELYEKTAGLLKAKGYDILLLNFRSPQNGAAWNPLSMPYRLYKSGNQDKAIELLDDLAANILYEENSANQDPFWEKTAADYFAGIALAMFEDTTEDKININSINMTATVGEDKFGPSTYIKEYFNLKDPASPAYVNASGTVMAPSDTKGSIISVFKQKVKLFASRENLSEMLSHSDIELESIGQKKTAVFIIIQDEKKTYHSLATIFIKQVYETLIDVAQNNGGKLPVRTNFLLDEFANMPPLKDVTTMITAARSRQIRFVMIIQNFAQLNKVYGKDDAETIKGNCGNIIYLISTELAALEEISKLCGDKKSKSDAKTASTPLVTISDLQRMKQFDHIILRMRKSPFKTSFVPDFKIDWGEEKSPKVDYPVREKKPVAIFDIREFVKENKSKKVDEIMANLGSGGFPGSDSGRSGSGFGGGFFPPKMGPSSSSSSKDKSVSINDIVQKIDAKLAALEKEEEEKKNANKAKPLPPRPAPSYDDDLDIIPDEEESPRIEIDRRNEPIRKEPEKAKPHYDDYDDYDDLLLDDDIKPLESRDVKPYQGIKRDDSKLYDQVDKKLHATRPENSPRIERDIEEEVKTFRDEDIPKINISPLEIERKVNEKLSKELYGDDLDLLAPIEKNSTFDDEERYTYTAPVEERKTPAVPEATIEPVVTHERPVEKVETTEDRKVFKDQQPLTLENVEEDEQFFDDFFDD